MQFSPEAILTIEFLVPCLLVLVFASGHVLKKRIVKTLIFSLATSELILVSFRPDDYNSDTLNYVNYIDALTNASGMEFLLLTKFEPMHLLLAAIARDFRLWVALEDAVAIGLLVILIRQTKRIETLAVVLGCSLPLWSSSLRFSVGLLAVAATLAVYRRRRGRLLLTTIVGSITHASLAVAGVFQRRKWTITFCVLLAFVAVAFVYSSILERAGVSEDTEFRPAGFRSFASLIGLMLYLRAYVPAYRRRYFSSDTLSTLGIFVLSTLFFPVINRWLILLMIIVAVDADALLDAAKVPRRVGAVAALLLFGALVVPFFLLTYWPASEH
jgi:hypothetical protein